MILYSSLLYNLKDFVTKKEGYGCINRHKIFYNVFQNLLANFGKQVQLRNATFGITQRSAKIKTEERALRTFPSAVKSLSLLPVQKLQNDGTVN
jgi:hypothetical protein